MSTISSLITRVMRPNRAVACAKLFLILGLFGLACTTRAQVYVLTQHNDANRTGLNASETALNTANVNSAQFGRLFSRVLDGDVYAQPLYVSKVGIAGGVHNVVYVATANDTVYAYDADNPNQTTPLWKRNLGPAVPSSVIPTINILNQVGIISTPVISIGFNPITGVTTGTIYVVAKTYESGAQIYRLHALDITTGAEVHKGPVQISASVAGTGDAPFGGPANTVNFVTGKQMNRAGLLLQRSDSCVGGIVYVGFASHEDFLPYHGWVMGFNSGDLQMPPAVYNTTPNGNMGGIWQGGAGLVGDGTNIYCMVGNGYPDSTGSSAENGGNGYGEAFLKLALSPVAGAVGAFALKDWFLPYNADSLNGGDVDLGSGGPMLIPGTNLLVGGGKEGVMYLLNTANMGRFHAGSDSQIVQSFYAYNGEYRNGFVYWNSPNNGPEIFCWGGSDVGRAYKLVNGRLQFAMQTPDVLSYGASNSPAMSVSANGSRHGTGILWAAMSNAGDSDHDTVTGVLRAFDADNLSTQLWASTETFNWAKFCPPTIANGKVYLATKSNELLVYGLLNRSPGRIR